MEPGPLSAMEPVFPDHAVMIAPQYTAAYRAAPNRHVVCRRADDSDTAALLRMAEFISAPVPRAQHRMEFSFRSALIDIVFLYLPSQTVEIVAVQAAQGAVLFNPPSREGLIGWVGRSENHHNPPNG